MKNSLCYLSLALGLTSGSAALGAFELATGTVYEDRNGNGRQESGEPGLEGVLVSNGRAVIATAADGAWSLPVDDDDILFVIKPRGYALPLDERHKPQFYYIHKPAGSPEGLDFAGVAPTGPLPEHIAFGLIPQEEPDAFTGLFFGDPQPYRQEEVDWFEADIVEEILALEQPFAFVSTLGDIVGDDLDLFEPMVDAVSRLEVPAWYVYGNHDMNFDVEHGHHADETFERVFGPPNYAFFMGPVCFVALDNVIYPRPDGRRGYVGGFTNEQLLFLENLLAHVDPEALIVF
ncbi:MAG: metallophosphoesterase N-terminal domain-containing protein [Verrucomicrobiota bacterium]